MEKRWCIIYMEKPWPGWLHSDPMLNCVRQPAPCTRTYMHVSDMTERTNASDDTFDNASSVTRSMRKCWTDQT